MRKLLRNLSMLAMTLVLGAQTASAAVEEYDFAAFVAGGAPTLTLSATEVVQAGTNAKTVYVVNNPTNKNAGETLDLKGRIALDSHPSTGNTMRWMWRSDTNAYKNGLAGNWNSKGTSVTSFNISILNLYAGDKITITYSIQSGKDAYLYTCSADIISPDGTSGNALAAATKAASGTEYTMMSDGNLDLYVTNNNMAIQKIKIESNKIAESIENPVIKVVGANGGDRIVSITGKNTNTDAATSTYYTLDDTDPTSTSTKYEGPITISSAQATDGNVTVKAITIKDGDTNVASDIASYTLTDVGTTLSLNAPVINMNFQKNQNNYQPVYSFVSDQSSLIGNPAVTYTYSINGESMRGDTYVANTTGELVVTASATGYTSASANVTIDNFLYERTFYYDFSSFAEHSETKVGNTTSVNGAGCQAYELASDAVEGITINMNLLWAITANKAVGLFARTGKGSIVYNGDFPDGSYAVFSNYGTPVVSNSTTTEFAQYGLARDMAVYVPTNSITISLPTEYTYSTFSSTAALDFTNNSDVEAYTAKADGSTVTLTKVEKVPANTGLILKKLGDATTATVSVAESADAVADNDLVAVTTAIPATDLIVAGNAYILVSDTQFAKVVDGASGELAAGKAYLKYGSDKNNAPMMLSFGETTAIKGVEVKAAQTDNAIYNLQGVRVSKPAAKGLYIINGKKHLYK